MLCRAVLWYTTARYAILYYTFCVVMLCYEMFLCNSVVLGVSPGHLLEMQFLLSHPRPIVSETLGLDPSNLNFNKSSR